MAGGLDLRDKESRSYERMSERKLIIPPGVREVIVHNLFWYSELNNDHEISIVTGIRKHEVKAFISALYSLSEGPSLQRRVVGTEWIPVSLSGLEDVDGWSTSLLLNTLENEANYPRGRHDFSSEEGQRFNRLISEIAIRPEGEEALLASIRNSSIIAQIMIARYWYWAPGPEVKERLAMRLRETVSEPEQKSIREAISRIELRAIPEGRLRQVGLMASRRELANRKPWRTQLMPNIRFLYSGGDDFLVGEEVAIKTLRKTLMEVHQFGKANRTDQVYCFLPGQLEGIRKTIESISGS
jgi:hypothetical protein